MPIFECSRCNELTYSASSDAVRDCARCGAVGHRVLDGDFEEARRRGRVLGPGDHAALIYDAPEPIAPFCARFLTDGVNAGERVLAGVEPGLRSAIAALLAPDVELVIEWPEPVSLYGGFDSERVCAMYEEMLAEASRRTRILAGMDRPSAAGVSAEQLDCYERAAHGLITKYSATVVCAYDATVLPDELLAIAERRHTLFIRDGIVRRSEQFEYEPA